MSENKIEPTNNAPHQKGANQESQISSDPTELLDSESNKVTGEAPSGTAKPKPADEGPNETIKFEYGGIL